MNWNSLLSAQREFMEHKKSDIRNAFQRDYDRIIFSNIFRRLQNKTQVFPLPGSKMVHNRLTHSLEVASVGRSIARIVSKKLCDKYGKDFLHEIYDIDTIVSAACLAHDLGNPPFGHSGEETISSYFKEGPGKELEKHIPEYKVEGNKVVVNVGSIDHPMVPEHFIEWVSIQTKQGNQRKQLVPGQKPEVCFSICEGDEVEAVYAYCNLHSLWKAE